MLNAVLHLLAALSGSAVVSYLLDLLASSTVRSFPAVARVCALLSELLPQLHSALADARAPSPSPQGQYRTPGATGPVPPPNSRSAPLLPFLVLLGALAGIHYLSACAGAQSTSSGAPTSIDWRSLVRAAGTEIPNTEAMVLAADPNASPTIRAGIDAAYATVPGDVATLTARTPCEALAGVQQIVVGLGSRVQAIPGQSAQAIVIESAIFAALRISASVTLAAACPAGAQ